MKFNETFKEHLTKEAVQKAYCYYFELDWVCNEIGEAIFDCLCVPDTYNCGSVFIATAWRDFIKEFIPDLFAKYREAGDDEYAKFENLKHVDSILDLFGIFDNMYCEVSDMMDTEIFTHPLLKDRVMNLPGVNAVEIFTMCLAAVLSECDGILEDIIEETKKFHEIEDTW